MNQDFLKAIHTTKNNDQMLISQMETKHLLNTIRFTLRKIVTLVPVESDGKPNPYKDALYGKQSLTPEQIADLVNGGLSGLSPYIFEAYFRTNEIKGNEELEQVQNECLSILETILGRSTKLEGFKPQQFHPRLLGPYSVKGVLPDEDFINCGIEFDDTPD